MSDKDIEIEIPADEPEAAVAPETKETKPATGKKAEAKAADKAAAAAQPETKTGPTPEEAVAALQTQLADEKAARLIAERRATEATGRATAAETEKGQTDIQLVTSAIDAVNSESSSLKAQLKEAFAASDIDAIADIQSKLGENGAKLFQLTQGKQQMEAAAKAPPRQQQQAAGPDPVEMLAAQLQPRSASWVRSHPQFAHNPRLYQSMVAAHNLVMSSDAPPETESDEYFAAVERLLGIKPALQGAADFGTADSALSAAAAPAATPVTRSGNGTGGSPRRITLTADEVEMAGNLGMTNEEYAKAKADLQKEGRLN